ncbi:MAG: hypothetical protein Q9218_003293 [Villophora microphyllina]
MRFSLPSFFNPSSYPTSTPYHHTLIPTKKIELFFYSLLYNHATMQTAIDAKMVLPAIVIGAWLVVFCIGSIYILNVAVGLWVERYERKYGRWPEWAIYEGGKRYGRRVDLETRVDSRSESEQMKALGDEGARVVEGSDDGGDDTVLQGEETADEVKDEGCYDRWAFGEDIWQSRG